MSLTSGLAQILLGRLFQARLQLERRVSPPPKAVVHNERITLDGTVDI
jgi:hypothetical protein